MGLDMLIGNLNHIGFYDFLLPYILFLAIVFGILAKYEPFKPADGSSSVFINGVIAISVSFFIINYTPIGLYFTQLFAITATVLGAILVLMLVSGMFGVDIKETTLQGNVKHFVVGFGAIVALIIFYIAAASYYGFNLFVGLARINSDTIITYVILTIMAVIVFFIIKSGNKS
jgi:hypothetical protein